MELENIDGWDEGQVRRIKEVTDWTISLWKNALLHSRVKDRTKEAPANQPREIELCRCIYKQGCTKKDRLRQFDNYFIVILHAKETFRQTLDVAQWGPLKLKFGS